MIQEPQTMTPVPDEEEAENAATIDAPEGGGEEELPPRPTNGGGMKPAGGDDLGPGPAGSASGGG